MEHASTQTQRPAGNITPNNFDLLRLLAAMQVALDHLDTNMLRSHGVLFFYVLHCFPGVPVFFFISGFLISASWERHPDPRSYLRNRFLRIFPAYWAAFALSLAGILLFYKDFDPVRNAVKLTLWIATQLAMLPDWNPAFLRGYGAGAANGSLWTIPIELFFYFSVPVLYWLFRKFRNSNLVLALVIIPSFALQYWILTPEFQRLVIPAALKTIGSSPFPWLGMFCFGILAQRNLTRLLPIVAGRAWQFAALYIAVMVATAVVKIPPVLMGTGRFMGIVNFPVLCLLLLAVAYTGRDLAERLLRRNDISYGLYLVHFPIMNMLLARGITGIRGCVLVLLASVGCAIASWTFVERPALALREEPLYRRGEASATVRP